MIVDRSDEILAETISIEDAAAQMQTDVQTLKTWHLAAIQPVAVVVTCPAELRYYQADIDAWLEVNRRRNPPN